MHRYNSHSAEGTSLSLETLMEKKQGNQEFDRKKIVKIPERKRIEAEKNQHKDEGSSTKTMRKYPAEAKATHRMKSCGSSKHRSFDRGVERNGMWLFPVVKPNFNTDTLRCTHMPRSQSATHSNTSERKPQGNKHACLFTRTLAEQEKKTNIFSE